MSIMHQWLTHTFFYIPSPFTRPSPPLSLFFHYIYIYIFFCSNYLSICGGPDGGVQKIQPRQMRHSIFTIVRMKRNHFSRTLSSFEDSSIFFFHHLLLPWSSTSPPPFFFECEWSWLVVWLIHSKELFMLQFTFGSWGWGSFVNSILFDKSP